MNPWHAVRTCIFSPFPILGRSRQKQKQRRSAHVNCSTSRLELLTHPVYVFHQGCISFSLDLFVRSGIPLQHAHRGRGKEPSRSPGSADPSGEHLSSSKGFRVLGFPRLKVAKTRFDSKREKMSSKSNPRPLQPSASFSPCFCRQAHQFQASCPTFQPVWSV
jgi:hypothetical protein